MVTISELIIRLDEIADMGIVNAREDTSVLREAAETIERLREALDPQWREYVIVDEGMFLTGVHDGEGAFTVVKNDALSFKTQAKAQEYLDSVSDMIGSGTVLQRGDIISLGGTEFYFFDAE